MKNLDIKIMAFFKTIIYILRYGLEGAKEKVKKENEKINICIRHRLGGLK